MKVLLIARRSTEHTPQDFAPLLNKEAKQALEFLEDDFFREIYSMADGGGAVILAEANSLEEAQTKASNLPLVQAGMLHIEYIPLKAYRAFKQAADLLS